MAALRKIGFHTGYDWAFGPTDKYGEVITFADTCNEEGMVAAECPNGFGVFGDHTPLSREEAQAYQACRKQQYTRF